MSKLAAIQMCSSEKVKENLQIAGDLIADAAKAKAKLVVLPEMFAILSQAGPHQAAEKLGEGPIQKFLSATAKKHKIWIVGGTIPLKTRSKNKVKAACLLYNSEGQVVVRYDKVHLFDVELSSTEIYKESDNVVAGDNLTLVNTPFGKLGFAICYDIRFPELFRCLFNQGMEILAIPAAFTEKTGRAHWELLTRSRAVENFCYVVGACQSGTHENGRKTWGRSLLINPWGQIITPAITKPGIVTADIDLNYLHAIRKSIPVDKHQKIFSTMGPLPD